MSMFTSVSGSVSAAALPLVASVKAATAPRNDVLAEADRARLKVSDASASVRPSDPAPPSPPPDPGELHLSSQQQTILAKIAKAGLQLSPDPEVIADLRARQRTKPTQVNLRLQLILNNLRTAKEVFGPASFELRAKPALAAQADKANPPALDRVL